ncbi:MAG: CPBP family intramembrane metalloprotease [Bacteroidetes bacterium]|nr:CPBP family intramembrane metalloprotease [Bacteroidota bacterium]
MEFIKSILFNTEERRFRAMVRIPIFLILFVFAMVIQRLAITPLMDLFVYYRIIGTPLSFALILGLLWLMAKIIDRRKMSGYGLEWNARWIKDLFFGLLLGIILISFVFFLELALGWVEIKDTFFVMEDRSFWPMMILSILLYIHVGFYEEATSRGYLLKNLAEGVNFKKTGPMFAVIFALLFTSFLFGLGHANNPNSTFVAWWNIVIIGALLAYTFVITKSLAISIGVHISWNFFQGCVYGFPVSGNLTQSSFLEINQLGDPLWTGGSFGPEAGLVIYFVAVIWLILLHIWLKYTSAKKEDVCTFADYTKDTLE